MSEWKNFTHLQPSPTTIPHPLNEYPAKVDVQIRVTEGSQQHIFSGFGSCQRDDDDYNPYGGIVYIYNDIDVKLYTPVDSGMYSTNTDGGFAFTGKETYLVHWILFKTSKANWKNKRVSRFSTLTLGLSLQKLEKTPICNKNYKVITRTNLVFLEIPMLNALCSLWMCESLILAVFKCHIFNFSRIIKLFSTKRGQELPIAEENDDYPKKKIVMPLFKGK